MAEGEAETVKEALRTAEEHKKNAIGEGDSGRDVKSSEEDEKTDKFNAETEKLISAKVDEKMLAGNVSAGNDDKVSLERVSVANDERDLLKSKTTVLEDRVSSQKAFFATESNALSEQGVSNKDKLLLRKVSVLSADRGPDGNDKDDVNTLFEERTILDFSISEFSDHTLYDPKYYSGKNTLLGAMQSLYPIAGNYPVSFMEFSQCDSDSNSRRELDVRSYRSVDRYPFIAVEEHDYSWAQMEEVKMVDPAEADKRLLTPAFLDLMCRKMGDRTKHLILRGSQLLGSLKRRVCDKDLIDIRQYLAGNERVVALDLAYNNITSEGVKLHLIPMLLESSSVKELVLSNNEICIDGLEALSGISSELNLTTLRLNGNRLGPKSGEALARLIDESKALLHLDVSETDQNVSSLACVAAVLRNDYSAGTVNRWPFLRRPPQNEKTSERRETVVCSPSQLGKQVKRLVSEQNALEDGPSLLTLSPSERSRINCPEEIDWTLPLKKIKLKKYVDDSEPVLSKVSDLSSEQNSKTWSLDAEKPQMCVCQPVPSEESNSGSSQASNQATDKRKPVLEVLFLDKILGHYHYQPLTYHFTRILSDMIKANDSLRELHLEKNSLTDSDIQVLCQGLRSNTTLKLLDLSANHIGCLGMSYLSECLSCIGLEALVLNHNDISDHGARCLFFTLPSTNLRMLDLAHNSISDAGMMDLLYAMRKQSKILALFIWGNPITHLSLQKVKEYLVQGWILTDSLDIQLYEVDDVLRHALKPLAHQYKSSYYSRPLRPSTWPPPPPQSFGRPMDFQHYDLVYSRTISQYIPKTFLYPPTDSNSCTT